MNDQKPKTIYAIVGKSDDFEANFGYASTAEKANQMIAALSETDGYENLEFDYEENLIDALSINDKLVRWDNEKPKDNKANKELLKLTNDYDNGVYVLCESGYEEETRRYLEGLGLKITEEETVTVMKPYAHYGNSDDELDWEFLNVEEF